MTGVLLLALISEVNWSLCKCLVRGVILRSPLVERRPQPSNLGFPAVTDRRCGVNLLAISTFCTGLLIVFLNSEVTELAGLTSYRLLWKSFGTVPR